MPIYEYQGQEYDINTMDPAEAKSKILKYLGSQKEATPKLELPQPEGFGEAAERSFVTNAQKISGAFGDMLGFPGTDKETYEKSLQRQGEMKKGENWYSPENLGAMTGALGVQLPATLAGAPIVAAASPEAVGGLGIAALTGLVGSAITAPGEYWGAEQEALFGGATPEIAKNMGRNAAAWTVAGNMLPGQGGLLGRAVKAAAQGVGAQVGESYAHNYLADGNEKLTRDPWDTNSLILGGLTSGALGAATGSRKGERWLSKNENQPEATPTPTPRTNIEKQLHTEALTTIDKVLAVKVKELDGLKEDFSNGIANEEMAARSTQLEEEVKNLSEQRNTIESLISGKNPEAVTDTKLTADLQLQRDRAARGQGVNKPREAAPGEDVPIHEELPPNWRETVDQETGEVAPTPTVPKKSPHEIAMMKIGESIGNPNKAAYNLQRAQDALDTLPDRVAKDETPGSEYSSRKEALETEIKAYKANIKGEEPDLNALVKKEPSIFRSEDEAFDATRNKQEALSQYEALRKTEFETRDILAERQALVEKPNKTLDDDLRIAELNDQYVESLVRNNPRNELKSTIDDLVGERDIDLPMLGPEDASYVRARTEQINKQLAKYMEFQRRAENSVRDGTTNQKTVQDILSLPENERVQALIDNKERFDTIPGSSIHFDKNLDDAQGHFRAAIGELLSKLGWLTGKDKQTLYFVVDNTLTKDQSAHHNIIGDVGVIHMNPEAIGIDSFNTPTYPTGLLDKFKNIYKKENTINSKNNQIRLLKVATHEIGHHLMLKVFHDNLRSFDPAADVTQTKFFQQITAAFKDWQTKQSATDPMFKQKSPYYRDHFAEFFAEEVSRALIFQHMRVSPVIKKMMEPVVKFLNAIRDHYKSLAGDSFDIAEYRSFVSDIVNTIIKRNEENSKVIWDEAKLHESNKLVDEQRGKRLFEGQTLETLMYDMHVRDTDGKLITNPNGGRIPMFAGEGKAQGAGPEQKSNLSFNFGMKFLTKRFGIGQIAQIFADNPHVQAAFNHIRNGQKAGIKAYKEIWNGIDSIESLDGKHVFTRFANNKDKSTPYYAVKHMKNEEAFNILQVAKKAFEEDITHTDAMAKYGAELTANEKKLYTTLAKMWDQQYQKVYDLQTKLKKKDELQYRNGWYPSVRNGQYQVNLSMQGHVFRSQTFMTETAAKAFQDKVRKLNAKHVDVSEVIDSKAEPSPDDMPRIDMIKDGIKRAFPSGGEDVNKKIDKMLASSEHKSGHLGKHHILRTNMEGARGTELFGSPKELGESFKKAITSSVEEFSHKMQVMYIKTYIHDIINNPEIDANTRMIVQQMFDNVVSNNKNWMESFDKYTVESIERMTKSVMERLGKEYKGDMLVGKKFMDTSMEWLYLTKIMAKLSFVLGQAAAPLQALRTMAIDGGMVMPWVSMGKGVMDLVTGKNPELRYAMLDTKNDSNTFEPQFIEALELTEGDKPIMTFIKDWLFTRRPAEVMDTYSRVVTFASLFNHYRDLGYDYETARDKAKVGTDVNMGAYGSADTASLLKHLGGAGNLMKPLQTLPTAMLGNLVADLARIARNPTKLKAYAPFLTYALTTMLIGGAMGLQGIQEYEAIRKMLEDNDIFSLPSVVDVMKENPELLETISTEGFDAQRALLLGPAVEVLGVDLASSLRANETFEAVVLSIISGHKAWSEAAPTVSFPAEFLGGAAKLAKHGMSLATGGTGLENAQLGKAIGAVTPAGPIGYGVKELAGTHETKLFGENTGMLQGGTSGEATKERTPTDTLAGTLGTKSTEDRANLLVGMRKIELDKRRQMQVKSAANKFAETGDAQHLARLISLDVKDTELENAVSNQVYNKIMDAKTRYFMNKQGRVNERKAERAVQYGDY